MYIQYLIFKNLKRINNVVVKTAYYLDSKSYEKSPLVPPSQQILSKTPQSPSQAWMLPSKIYLCPSCVRDSYVENRV